MDWGCLGRKDQQRVKKLFELVDADKDGIISFEELRASNGDTMQPSRMQSMFRKLDRNKDGHASFEDWTRFWVALRKAKGAAPFNKFLKDLAVSVTEHKAPAPLEVSGQPPDLPPETVYLAAELFGMLDLGANGSVSMAEFNEAHGSRLISGTWNVMDLNKDGYLSLKELLNVLEVMQSKRGSDCVTYFIKHMITVVSSNILDNNDGSYPKLIEKLQRRVLLEPKGMEQIENRIREQLPEGAAVMEAIIGHGEVTDLGFANGMQRQDLLMAACWRDNIAYVHALMVMGTDSNCHDSEGCSALMYAVLGGCIGAMKAMYNNDTERQVDVYHQDSSGRTALMISACEGHLTAAALLCTWAIHKQPRQLLFLNVPDNLGNNALHYAALNGHLSFVAFLLNPSLNPSFDLHLTNHEGKDAVQLATETGHTETAVLLAENMVYDEEGPSLTLQQDVNTLFSSDDSEELYNEALDKGGVPWQRSRLMLVGEGAVGKTSTLRSLMKLPFVHEHLSTNCLQTDHIRIDRNNIQDWTKLREDDLDCERMLAVQYLEKFRQDFKESDEVMKRINEVDVSKDPTQCWLEDHMVEWTSNTSGSFTEPVRVTKDELVRACQVFTLIGEKLKPEYQEQVLGCEKPWYCTDLANRANDYQALVDSHLQSAAAAAMAEHQFEGQTESDGIVSEGYSTNNVVAEVPVAQELKIPVVPTSAGLVAAEQPQVTELCPLTLQRYVEDGVNTSIVYSTWDYAGQDVICDALQLFLPRTGLYLTVFSMAKLLNEESRQQTLDYLDYWFEAIHLYAYDQETSTFAPVLIVGTCAPVNPSDEPVVLDDAAHREVSQLLYEYFDESMAFNAMIRNPPNSELCFYPMSNWRLQDPTEDAVMNDLREAIDQHVRSDEMGYIEQQVPITWLNTCDRLKQMDEVHLDRQTVETVAQGCRVFDGLPEERRDGVLSRMLECFHGLGVLVYYNDSALRQHVVLQPQYLIDRIGCVIRDYRMHHKTTDRSAKVKMRKEWIRFTKEGRLAFELLQYLWADLSNDVEQQQYLLGLLDRFCLVCPLPSVTNEFLVPSLLPDRANVLEIESPKASHGGAEFSFVFNGFLPQGFFHRLMAKAFDHSWVLGGTKPIFAGDKAMLMAFSYNEQGQPLQFRLEFDPICKCISVSIEKKAVGEAAVILQLLKGMADDLNREFYNSRLEFETLVTCDGGQFSAVFEDVACAVKAGLVHLTPHEGHRSRLPPTASFAHWVDDAHPSGCHGNQPKVARESQEAAHGWIGKGLATVNRKASLDEKFQIVLSYRTEAELEMHRVAKALEAHYGARCVVHGLMCMAGQPWDRGYFSWLENAPVRLMLLSPTYFSSPACRLEFKEACNGVPDPTSKERVVIPVILTHLDWKYPDADPNCPPDLKAQLRQRNPHPNPNSGCLMDDFDTHMAGLIQAIEPWMVRDPIGASVADVGGAKPTSHDITLPGEGGTTNAVSDVVIPATSDVGYAAFASGGDTTSADSGVMGVPALGSSREASSEEMVSVDVDVDWDESSPATGDICDVALPGGDGTTSAIGDGVVLATSDACDVVLPGGDQSCVSELIETPVPTEPLNQLHRSKSCLSPQHVANRRCIVLMKTPHQRSFGLILTSNDNGLVFVKDMKPGGLADMCPNLYCGDQVLEVNQCSREFTMKEQLRQESVKITVEMPIELPNWAPPRLLVEFEAAEDARRIKARHVFDRGRYFSSFRRWRALLSTTSAIGDGVALATNDVCDVALPGGDGTTSAVGDGVALATNDVCNVTVPGRDGTTSAIGDGVALATNDICDVALPGDDTTIAIGDGVALATSDVVLAIRDGTTNAVSDFATLATSDVGAAVLASKDDTTNSDSHGCRCCEDGVCVIA